MKAHKILNITNGDAFNEHFTLRSGEIALSFCETMMDGEAVSAIFSDNFIKMRASELNVSIDEYIEKATVFCTLKSSAQDYSELILWFGKDTFCQTNLLTLLAFFEQIGYKGKVTLNYIDDETHKLLEKDINVKLGFYKKLYDDILVRKIRRNADGVILQNAIDLYYDYHSENGRLANMIRNTSADDEFSLICLLLEKTAEYGLSDIQTKKLIKKYR